MGGGRNVRRATAISEWNKAAGDGYAVINGDIPENGHIAIKKVEVPANAQAPDPGEKKNNFIDVSAFRPGSVNVFVPGPWVNFWCSDCGRKLAPRSIHDHWKKAHGGDPYNTNGLQNIAAEAVDLFMKNKLAGGVAAGDDDGSDIETEKTTNPKRVGNMLEMTDAKKAKVAKVAVKSGKACALFGPRVSATEIKNPFFEAVDATPEQVKSVMDKTSWIDVLLKTHGLKQAQFQQAMDAIKSHFEV